MKLKLSYFSKNAKLFLAANFFYSFAMNIYFIFFNLYLLEIGKNEKQIGAIASISALSGGIVILLISPYLSSIKQIRALKISMVGAFLSILGYTLTSDFEFFVGLSVLFGASTAFFGTMQIPISMKIVKQSMRKYYFAISTAIFILNGTIANGFTGFFPDFLMKHSTFSEILSYKITLLSVGISFILVFIFLKFIDEPERIVTEKVPFLKNIKNLPIKKFIIIGLPTFMIGIGAGLMVPLFNVYFKQKLNFSLIEISIIFMVSQLVMGMFTLITPILTKRFRPVTFIFLTQALSLPFILMIICTKSIIFVTIAFTLRASFMNMSRPIQMHFEMACFKTEYRAAFSAFKSFFWNISWAISTLIAGFFQYKKIFDVPLYLTFFLYIVTLLYIFIKFFRKEEQYLQEVDELAHF